MKYLFYAIIYDVAGNTTAVGSLTTPAKKISTNIQKVTGISINLSGSVIKQKNDTFTITPAISPDDADNKNVIWSSSDSSIATVNSDGLISCLKAGTATITVTSAENNSIKASLSLTVNDKVTITTFSYSSTSIDVGKTSATPTVSITGTPMSGPTYSSSNTGVATINATTGVVTGVAKGTSTITITYTNYDGTKATKTCNITIIQPVTGIAISKTSETLYLGGTTTTTINATISPTNANNQKVNWSTSNANIVAISSATTSSGVNITLTAKGKGTATITATAAGNTGLTKTCTVTVGQKVTGITLSQTSAALATGDTLNLTATVTPTTADNKSVTWTSSNTNVATVSSSGVVTVKNMGTATITATAVDGSGKSAKCQITPAWILNTTGNASGVLVENPSTSNPTKLIISGSGQSSEAKLTYKKTIPSNATVSITFMGKRNSTYYISMWVNGEDHYLSGGYSGYYPNYANFNANTKYTYNYQGGASQIDNWYVSAVRGVTTGYDLILEIYSILLNGNRIL